jgi:drug/metabolite transporter (DMT)-like permease
LTLLEDKKQLVTGLLLSLSAVFFSSTIAAVSKGLSADVHVSAIVFFQYGISFLLTLPAILRAGRGSVKTTKPAMHLLRGISGCACFYLFYIALGHISLLESTLLRVSAPLMVPLVIFAWFKVGVSSSAWPPLIIGFIGVLLVLNPSFSGFSVWHLLALVSGLGLAISMVSTRELAKTEPQSRILFYYFVVSLAVSLPFFVINYQPIPSSAWLGLIYIGVTAYLSFVLYTMAYRYVSAAALAPASYFAVVFSGFFDWLIWDHVPSTLTTVGILCVVFGGVLVLRPRPESEPKHR